MRFLQSKYEIRLTGDAKMTIEGDKNGLHIAESSENCQIISKKHEKISKKLCAQHSPILVLIELPQIAFLVLGIISLLHSNYGVAATMLVLSLVWGLLSGHGLKQTFKK